MSKLAIIGPGETFGRELIVDAQSRGLRVVSVSRSAAPWHELSDEHFIADVVDDSEDIADYFVNSNVSHLLFNVRSGTTKDLCNIEGLVHDIEVGAFSALSLHGFLQRRRHQLASFTVTGGNFGDEPDIHYPGLSLEKMMLHGIARDLAQRDLAVKLAILDGDFTKADSEVTARRLIDFTLSGKNESTIRAM